ncbi:hypothetical protein LLOABG_LLOABG_06210, partial [Dysosmobacter welbionis]
MAQQPEKHVLVHVLCVLDALHPAQGQPVDGGTVVFHGIAQQDFSLFHAMPPFSRLKSAFNLYTPGRAEMFPPGNFSAGQRTAARYMECCPARRPVPFAHGTGLPSGDPSPQAKQAGAFAPACPSH